MACCWTLFCLEEVLPQLSGPFDVIFFDQRGSRFLKDLQLLFQKPGLLAEEAVLVADNVLKPGAPSFWLLVLYIVLYFLSISPHQLQFPGSSPHRNHWGLAQPSGFLWHLQEDPSQLWETCLVELPDFGSSGVLDWMSVSKRVKKMCCAGAHAVQPEEISHLAWQADEMRWRFLVPFGFR